MNVAHILKEKGTDVLTARPGASVREIARLLNEKRVGAVVITDPDGSVAGIVSERDIVRAVAEHGASCLKLEASEVMTRRLQVCAPEDTVFDLMSQMTDHRIRHLPVVVEGRLRGIVSIGDLVKQRIAEVEFEADEMKRYISTG